jgi:predicted metal-dependent hydrolase
LRKWSFRAGIVARMADVAAIRAALALVRSGDGFAAHEELEELWRAAAPAERDLYQGLVHVAVATYQESRGNPVGRRRQLEKARRRLEAYEPEYEGIAIAAIRDWCTRSLSLDRCPRFPADDAVAGG